MTREDCQQGAEQVVRALEVAMMISHLDSPLRERLLDGIATALDRAWNDGWDSAIRASGNDPR